MKRGGAGLTPGTRGARGTAASESVHCVATLFLTARKVDLGVQVDYTHTGGERPRQSIIRLLFPGEVEPQTCERDSMAITKRAMQAAGFNDASPEWFVAVSIASSSGGWGPVCTVFRDFYSHHCFLPGKLGTESRRATANRALNRLAARGLIWFRKFYVQLEPGRPAVMVIELRLEEEEVRRLAR